MLIRNAIIIFKINMLGYSSPNFPDIQIYYAAISETAICLKERLDKRGQYSAE